MRTLLLSVLLVAAALPFAPSASACAPPQCQILPDVCVKGQTDPQCWEGHDVCFVYGYQVPQCVDLPTVDCTEVCSAVSVCAKENACRDGHDVCVGGTKVHGFCLDYVECLSCDPPQQRSGGEPQCLMWYYEADYGVVRIVQRDSCHREVYVLDQQVLPLTP